MPTRFQTPRFSPNSDDGSVLPQSTLDFFEKGSTTTRKDTFTTRDLGTANANPVVADGDGRFSPIWLSGSYRVVLREVNTDQVWDEDDISGDLVANETSYELGSSAAAASHSGIITGHIIETNYYDSNRTLNSGGKHAFTGTTTAARIGGVAMINWPFTDGYFYDQLGQQFAYEGSPINVRVFGATGDGATDDVVAFQSACDFAIVSGVGASVYFPKGIYYFIANGLRIGNSDGSRVNGFRFYGDAFKSSEIVWKGGGSGTVIECKGVKSPIIDYFYLRSFDSSNEPDIGLHIHGGTSSGGAHQLNGVEMSGPDVGLRIGSNTASEDSVPGGGFHNLNIANNSIAAVEILGSDTDGQQFYNLITANCPVVIKMSSARTVNVYGGVHSNPTSTGLGYPAFNYMTADGVLGGGNYSISNIRIEGGVGLLTVGTALTSTANADDEDFEFTASGIHHASVPTDIAARPIIIQAGQNGSYILENCWFRAPNSGFNFFNIARTNRFANLHVTRCGFNDSSDDPEVFGNLITVTGNGGGAFARGGLRAYLKGNVKVANALSNTASGILNDREIAVTAIDADLDVKTITGATQASPCEITTSASHGYVTGDKISIIEVIGMTELNGINYAVTVTAGTTFTLDGIDSSAFTAYSSAGQSTRPRFRELDNGHTLTRSTTLTTAEVNAVRATPIELVPAPGAGKVIEFVSATLFYNYTTTAFTVGGDEDFVIQYDASTDVTASIESTGFIDQTNDEIRLIEPTWTATTDLVALVNKKLEIFNTGAGETADGGTSTLKVTVNYRIHTTGL